MISHPLPRDSWRGPVSASQCQHDPNMRPEGAGRSECGPGRPDPGRLEEGGQHLHPALRDPEPVQGGLGSEHEDWGRHVLVSVPLREREHSH